MMLLAAVHSFIQRYSLLDHGQHILIGVSGGPDSLTLLHLLTRLRDEYDLHLRAAHLNHQLRPDADADSDFVARAAASWNVPCTVERVNIESFARENKLSIEEAGRRARYEFFARLGNVVAVAHNADDQAETVLMHFLRGSGVGGLRGMLPKSSNQWAVNNGIIRPLLNVARKEIEAYCLQHNLQPRIDSTNTDTTYYRNRLRHELLPILETYNPNIREILCRVAEVSSGDYDLLRGVIQTAWDAVTISPADSDLVAFDLAKWRAMPLALQRALLRQAVQQLRSDTRDVDFVPIDKAARWIASAQSGGTADLLAGLCVRVSGSILKICDWQTLSVLPPISFQISLSLNQPIPFNNWQITATVLDAWSLDEIASNADSSVAYLDGSFDSLILRTRRAGDRFEPLGMNGKTIKLSDFMINQKIPMEDRDRLPLLVDGDTVFWVCGYRLSERAKVSRQTRRVLRVKIEKM
ncbi:MAG: tRNA lysidine(34) synthetase TilS [Chloroflexi bacterium]|nr:tRNA lysidine(34) synthetase TilS [Chloroflexota bacterium]